MEAVNKKRRARKQLCKELGITNKQLRKSRILNREYVYRNDMHVFTGGLR